MALMIAFEYFFPQTTIILLKLKMNLIELVHRCRKLILSLFQLRAIPLD